MKKITGKEVLGSFSIAAALYMGALAMHQHESAAQDAAAAAQFKHEYDVTAESGAAGQANAAVDAYESARAKQKRDMDGAVTLGALGVVALGVGLDALGRQAKEDSRKRTSVGTQRTPDFYPIDDVTQPLAVHMQPAPEAYPFDDSTQRITHLTVPVPRSEPTGVAKHRAA